MKVGDLVRFQNQHNQWFVGIIIGNAGYKSFINGGWFVLHSGGKILCENCDMELVSESR